jgi:predicted acetyltransferase
MIDIDEAARLFPPIYDELRRVTPGMVDRPEARWRNLVLSDEEWMRHGDGPTYRAVIEVDGQPRGYTIHRIKSSWTDRGPANRLLAQEVAALDPDAEQRLWQWLSVIDLVGTVALWRGPVPHPLQLWLHEPRRLGLTVIDSLWLRILDLPATLAARTYAGEGSVVLDVSDDLIDSNAGRWQLTARGEEPATVERSTAEPDLAIDIAALASAYLGAFRMNELARAGQVRELRPGALRQADVLFTSPHPPFSNTMF